MDPTQTLLDALNQIPGLGGRVYDGDVPAQVPTDGKWIKPYVAVWAGVGGDVPNQRDLTLLTDPEGLDWRPQTTVVGANAQVCRQAAAAVRGALANLPIGAGWLKPDDDLNRQLTPLADHTVTPARMFLPLRWRLITTT